MKACFFGHVLKTRPRVLDELESFVVYDDFDNPIIAVRKLSDGTIALTRAGDKGFEAVLKAFGIRNLSEITVEEFPK